MKTTLLIVALLAASAYSYTTEEHEFLWEAWKLEHQKTYDNAFEAVRRFKIFKDNLAAIDAHNADETQTYTLGMNQFGDMTNAEFKEKMASGLRPRNVRRSTESPELDTTSLPSSIDWVSKGAVTPVKNQGQCGSCWSFSTTGSVEGATEIATGKLLSLSEQELMDCSTSYGNKGCNGGLMDDAFKFIMAKGITTESNYPYQGKDTSCNTQKEDQPAAKITGYHDVTKQSPSQMMAAVAQGPVSVAIEADQFGFQFYMGGVFSGSCGTNLDHGVLVVGYGTDSGKAYWKVKNSWGASWGMQGYILLQRKESSWPGQCGVLMSASYPTGASLDSAGVAADKAVSGVWSSCAKSGDALSGLNVEVSPNPPVKGASVTVTATGTLDETVTAGTADLEISVLGIPVVKKTYDICTLLNKYKCPVAAGPLDMSVTEKIPSTVPSGAYTGKVTITDQNGNEVTCINLSFDIQ